MTWLPSALLFACFGAVASVAAAGLVVCWLARYAWAALVAMAVFDWRRRVWGPLLGVSRPACDPPPKRYPAPPVQSPRPDLEAALRSKARALNRSINNALGSALPEPSQGDFDHVVAEAIRATRDAATHKP